MLYEDINKNSEYLCITGFVDSFVKAHYYRVLWKDKTKVVATTYWQEPIGLKPEAFLEEATEELKSFYNTPEKLAEYIKQTYPEFFI